MPQASISAALRSTVVKRRGSLPGRRISAGWRSKVIATVARPAFATPDATMVSNDRLVPAMDAVEEPDGRDRRPAVERERRRGRGATCMRAMLPVARSARTWASIRPWADTVAGDAPTAPALR